MALRDGTRSAAGMPDRSAGRPMVQSATVLLEAPVWKTSGRDLVTCSGPGQPVVPLSETPRESPLITGLTGTVVAPAWAPSARGGRFRTCAGPGLIALSGCRAGTCLPAMARHEAPRGVPAQVGNRSAVPQTFAELCDLHAARLPLSGRAGGGDLWAGWVARSAARRGRVDPNARGPRRRAESLHRARW
jgi:hypothetical protein